MTTVFVTPPEWEGEHLELSGAAHHHLFRVGRMAVGDSLRLADGAGRARTGTVEFVDRQRARIRLGARVPGNEPGVHVQLLVVAPKKPRAEWLVEKTTELGVGAIRFLRSARGPRSFGEGAFERFRRIAVSAACQCARARIPEISGMHEIEGVERLIRDTSSAFVLDCQEDSRGDALDRRLAPAAGADSVSLLVGPEGGWSQGELTRFAELGLPAVGLGRRILRVETAAIVAVARCVASD